MDRIVLTSSSGLEALAVPGRHGAAADPPGVRLSLPQDFALVTVMARKGRAAALAARVRENFGIELPLSPRRAAAGGVAFVWAGPGHWLALAADADGTAFEARLGRELEGLASVAGQTGGRTLIRIRGPKARAALQKGVMLDLDPRAFAAGDAAVTSVAHVGVHLWLLDAAPTFEAAMFRSFAVSFWRWLLAAGAEFGIAIEPEP